MAGKSKIKLNLKGFRALRNDPAVVADLERRARAVAAAAGAGFEASAQKGKNRARASVITGDFRSRREQAKSNVLQRALNSGR